MDRKMSIPSEIIRMVAEATTEHNDGKTKQGFKDELAEIRDYIDRILDTKSADIEKEEPNGK